VKIALLQHACDADPAANLKTATAMAREAAESGATLVVTQELFASALLLPDGG
jgi:N-carbamoylputrescine amidase